MDAIKALKDIRDITMNRLTLIHKEIYDIADAAIREASAEGCTASPPKTVRDWPAGDLPPCPPYQNGLSYSPPKEERRELGPDEKLRPRDYVIWDCGGKSSGEWVDEVSEMGLKAKELVGYPNSKAYRPAPSDKKISWPPPTSPGSLDGSHITNAGEKRPAPAQGEKKHEEGYTGMRVELVNHGGEDKFEIVLQKGGGIWVLSVEKAEQLANWILELLDV
jgi:hypothetical protein